VIGSAIVSALDRLDLHSPKVDKADRSEFKQVREALLAEEKATKKLGGQSCVTPSSFPAKAGNPVRCGLSVLAEASGILGHPPQCAIAHKAGDDDRM
jgi:hypothetical protein